MQPLRLTLTGFKGIRSGLGRETITLDLERLGEGATLIAIAGGNGSGKSTLIDNLQPYLTLPSRAANAGPGGFSYYDHVALPENQKDLVWAHEGRSYRSQVLIRLGPRRRTEAYLYELDQAGNWVPARMQDGTVSDGRIDTYNRCVEAICGSEATFFTSVFSAQGKRQLSAYRHAEIKALLADILGQDEIRALGEKAQDTARLLKAALTATRQQEARWQEESNRLSATRPVLNAAAQEGPACDARKSVAQTRLLELQEQVARLKVEHEQSVAVESRRQALNAQLAQQTQANDQTLQVLGQQVLGEQQRADRLQQRINERVQRERQQRQAIQVRRQQCEGVLGHEPKVRWARHRLPSLERIAHVRDERVAAHKNQVHQLQSLSAAHTNTEQHLNSLEREAGQAALRNQDLARRFGLVAQVPCAGMPMQGQCQLLGDARDAQVLIPDAQALLQRLANERDSAKSQLGALDVQRQQLQHAPQALALAERRQQRTAQRLTCLTLLDAKQGEMTQARATLQEAEQALEKMGITAGPTPEEQAEQAQIEDAQRLIQAQRERQLESHARAQRQLQLALEELPPTVDERSWQQAMDELAQAEKDFKAAEQAHLEALHAVDRLAVLQTQQQALATRQVACQTQAQRIEKELSRWVLFAKCMGADGLIALAIDDAGPALSALANDLLKACDGGRFSVCIQTLLENQKKEQKEGFDIVVHDAESGQSQSVTLMSGGEKVLIEACLTRAIALYLAQGSGRRYSTLFSDEADGPLDIDRKRIFMAMKREVLRLGGYEREFYISQTPELTAMADAVIDMDLLRQELDCLPV